MLKELAQKACVGLERSGYYTCDCNFGDVGDCHAERYGGLTCRRVPYSENRKDGAISREYVCERLVLGGFVLRL
jgi:hypothetical protein